MLKSQDMKRYGDSSGGQGVLGYELGIDRIIVKFQDGRVYKYSYRSAGANHVERMKDLAEKGKGLTTYINRHVKDLYED